MTEQRSVFHRRALGVAFLLVATAFMIELTQVGGLPACALGVAMFLTGAAFQCIAPFLV